MSESTTHFAAILAAERKAIQAANYETVITTV